MRNWEIRKVILIKVIFITPTPPPLIYLTLIVITCNKFQENLEGHTTVQYMSRTKHNLPPSDGAHSHHVLLHRHTTGNQPGYQQWWQHSGKCWGDSMRLWLSIQLTINRKLPIKTIYTIYTRNLIFWCWLLTFCMLGNFSRSCCRLLTFFQNYFFS